MSRIRQYFAPPVAVVASAESLHAAVKADLDAQPVTISIERYNELCALHLDATNQLTASLEHGFTSALAGRELQITAQLLTTELGMAESLTVSQESFDVGNEGFSDVFKALTGVFKAVGTKLKDIGALISKMFNGIVGTHNLRLRAQQALNKSAAELRGLLARGTESEFVFNLRPYSARLARGRTPLSNLLTTFTEDLDALGYLFNTYMTDTWTYLDDGALARNASIDQGYLSQVFERFMKEPVPGFAAHARTAGGKALIGNREFQSNLARGGSDAYRRLEEVRQFGFLKYQQSRDPAPMLTDVTVSRSDVETLINYLESYGSLLGDQSTRWKAMPDMTAIYKYELDDGDMTDYTAPEVTYDQFGNATQTQGYSSPLAHIQSKVERAIIIQLDDTLWSGYYQLAKFLTESFKVTYDNAVTLAELLRTNLK